MIVQLGDLGDVEIGPMVATERALVLSSWMQSSGWSRRDVLAVVDGGAVLMARSEEGIALGWVAVSAGRAVHGYVKSGYRGNGVMRALWNAAGRPTEHVEDAHRRVRKVLEKLKGGGDARHGG